MKKLVVNEDLCFGCGACCAIDTKHFEINEEGKSSVTTQEDIENDTVNNAIASCPANAISIEEE